MQGVRHEVINEWEDEELETEHVEMLRSEERRSDWEWEWKWERHGGDARRVHSVCWSAQKAKQIPIVGLEPTTTRLRVLRSTD